MSLRTAVRRRTNPAAVRLPDGTVTFLMTDVEASAPAWDADADRMDQCLRDLDDRIHDAVAANVGRLIKARGEGDSAFAVFNRGSSAILAAYELQRALATHVGFGVRAAIHTGEARCRDGDYFGVIPNRTARLRALAHGGQTIVSHVTAELAEPELPESLSLYRLGAYRIRDWPRAEEIFELRGPGVRADFPPLRVWGETGRALMTIVCVDVEGASKALAGKTEAEVVDVQRALFGFLGRALNDHSGRFLKFMGDGCIALFDEPLAALGFARALAEASPNLRTVIHAGIVELAYDDVIGPAVSTAHRAVAFARGGEIVATRVIAELLAGQGVGFRPRAQDVLVVDPA